MGDVLLGVSQSSLILQHYQPKLSLSFKTLSTLSSSSPYSGSILSFSRYQQLQNRNFKALSVVSSDSTITASNAVNSAKDDLDTGGGGGGDRFGGDFGGQGGRGGGGGGGGSGGAGGEGKRGGEGAGGESEDSEKKMAFSLSQKLTLSYAALVGVGGMMGYLKTGSQKSLAAGGLSAAALYYVFTQLPTQPVFAASVGLGVSGALLGVMGARFKSSGKVFPAGVVSLASLVMAVGYLHGIIRSSIH